MGQLINLEIWGSYAAIRRGCRNSLKEGSGFNLIRFATRYKRKLRKNSILWENDMSSEALAILFLGK